jgi:hypothetical protein
LGSAGGMDYTVVSRERKRLRERIEQVMSKGKI